MGTTNTLRSYNEVQIIAHDGLYDDTNGDILQQIKITQGSQLSKVNNADLGTTTLTQPVEFDEFNIGQNEDGIRSLGQNAALDLEFLAVFPASITDAQADDVRKYINNRNNVFLRHDTDGYYFFDGAATTDGQVFSGSSSWLGRIVGSDNDDPFKYLSNGSINDRPTTDGYKITFADNSDHFLFNTPLSNGLAGWQVVGTSLGTFAYKVNANAVTELNLLGNRGTETFRKAGDLYGIILLPQTAIGEDVTDARKLLIDRGASDAAGFSNYYAAWYQRTDIVEFSSQTFPDATDLGYAWASCISMTDFGTISAKKGVDFSNAWNTCSSLTSFPAGAKLGTEVNYVDFNNAWRDSGLTSFPALDLSNGDNFTNAWRDTSDLTEIASGLQLGNNPAYTGVSFTRAWQDSGLTSFPALDLSRGNSFDRAWLNCSALTSFPADAKLGTEANNVNFKEAWRDSGLTSFPALDLSNAITLYGAWRGCNNMLSFGLVDTSSVTNFDDAWLGCASLTSFPLIDTSSGTNFYRTWYDMDSVTDFPLLSVSAGRHFNQAWRFCVELINFPAGLFDNWNPSFISSGVFNLAWDGCTALTAQSVENILTSIDASGQYATSDGDAYVNGVNTQLADAGITIDYDGTTLSAATNSAVDSLKAKGWSIIVNNVTL